MFVTWAFFFFGFIHEYFKQNARKNNFKIIIRVNSLFYYLLTCTWNGAFPYPTTFHWRALHFTGGHYISLEGTTFHWRALYFTGGHYISLKGTIFHWRALHFTGGHYISLEGTTFHWRALNFTEVHYISPEGTTFHWRALHFTGGHYISLEGTTFHWRAIHFTMRILKKGNGNTKSLAYMSLVRPILKYGAACWDPYREGQIIVLDRVQKKAAKFAHHTNSSNWETLASRRKL